MTQQVSKPTIKIELTEKQKDQIRQQTGKEVTEVKLAPEELEERVSPGLAGN